MMHFLCFHRWKSFVNKVSLHSSRPYFAPCGASLTFKAKRKIWGKEKAFRPTKCFFLLDAPAHWNAKDAKRLDAFPGVRIWRLTGHFVRAFDLITSHEESPVEQDISRTGISYGDVWSCVWNSRETAPWERITITPGCPFFGSLLWASKEMNSHFFIAFSQRAIHDSNSPLSSFTFPGFCSARLFISVRSLSRS